MLLGFVFLGQQSDDFEYTVGENKKIIRMYLIVNKDGCVYDLLGCVSDCEDSCQTICQDVYLNVVRICFLGQQSDDLEYTVGENKK